ncbi:cytochrome c [Ideonella sp.]|uniref:c-type cytochrome n=1 Tax=Ideonella sp. TaxID=1929293 RepID=UPI002B49449B|nr:cytochrome c [Ideonella sp.]HJV69021.1 cytochrome c [Ideonella sp.]
MLVVAVALAVATGAVAEPAPARQQQLVRMVRQDCGSCHGMRLTGGLGPALTREALADRLPESVAATIFHGRPGTPMPPWRAMLDEGEARWIAERLQAGFPEESPRGADAAGVLGVERNSR